MVNTSNKKYREYKALVDDILASKDFKKMDGYKHHYGTSRMQHSINVSYYSYIISKKFNWDYTAVARAGLLHDFFHYECHNHKLGMFEHAAIHPEIALKNAQALTPLSNLEKDIIKNHMWLCGRAVPKFKESYLVSLIDKYSAVYEALWGICKNIRKYASI